MASKRLRCVKHPLSPALIPFGSSGDEQSCGERCIDKRRLEPAMVNYGAISGIEIHYFAPPCASTGIRDCQGERRLGEWTITIDLIHLFNEIGLDKTTKFDDQGWQIILEVTQRYMYVPGKMRVTNTNSSDCEIHTDHSGSLHDGWTLIIASDKRWWKGKQRHSETIDLCKYHVSRSLLMGEFFPPYLLVSYSPGILAYCRVYLS